MTEDNQNVIMKGVPQKEKEATQSGQSNNCRRYTNCKKEC